MQFPAIPSGWQTKRLKFVSTINDEVLPESTAPESTIHYVDIGDVTSQGKVTGSTQYRFDQAPSRARRIVRDGDAIVSTVRTYLRAIAPIRDPAPDLIVSTGFAVVRPRELDTSFAAFAFRAPYFVDRVVAASTGVSYPAINASTLGDLSVLVPPLPTQRAIAAFLDRETAKIDTLIEKKRRLLDLLDEKRTALITCAVTRGLDPDVPMKDSGVEWLGEIPAHWEVQTCGARFTQVDERGFPDLPLLEVSIRDGVSERTFSDDRIEQQAEDWNTYKRAREADIAFNKMRMWQGAVGVAPLDGLVSPDYTVARPRDGTHSRYYELLFRTNNFLTEVNRHSHGIVDDRNRLYWQGFKSIRIPVPSLQEQEAIVRQMQQSKGAIDQLSQHIHHAISLLQEYRTALISAAVTGQIDVSEAAA